MKCEICGKEIPHSYYANATLCASSECFSKHYWNERLKSDDKIVVNGTCYWQGKEDEDRRSAFRGFGGSPFYIKMLKDNENHKAGEIFKSTNMWHNGDIPKEYNVEDNAVFLTREEYDEFVSVKESELPEGMYYDPSKITSELINGGTNLMIKDGHLKVELIDNSNMLRLKITCPFCKKVHELLVNKEDYDMYVNGAKVQDAFRSLSADDRERIISGICPECWDNTFGNDEED